MYDRQKIRAELQIVVRQIRACKAARVESGQPRWSGNVAADLDNKKSEASQLCELLASFRGRHHNISFPNRHWEDAEAFWGAVEDYGELFLVEAENDDGVETVAVAPSLPAPPAPVTLPWWARWLRPILSR